MTDPWKHRSVNMRCGTCMHYAPKATVVTSGVRTSGS